MAGFKYIYSKAFVFYSPTFKYTWKERYTADLRTDWGVSGKALKNLSVRRLKRLFRCLKMGKKNLTGHRTLLSQYRREAKVVQIYK